MIGKKMLYWQNTVSVKRHYSGFFPVKKVDKNMAGNKPLCGGSLGECPAIMQLAILDLEIIEFYFEFL